MLEPRQFFLQHNRAGSSRPVIVGPFASVALAAAFAAQFKLSPMIVGMVDPADAVELHADSESGVRLRPEIWWQ